MQKCGMQGMGCRWTG